MIVVSLKQMYPGHAKQAALITAGVYQGAQQVGRWIITVDDDIDPRDPDSVHWAMSYRMQPNRDVRIIQGITAIQDYSLTPPGGEQTYYPLPSGGSAMLINATTKWDYPPVSLPKKQFMERAKQIWEEEGFPKLKPVKPWFGYSLGYWPKELEEEAELALKGQHFQTGEKMAKKRIKL